MLVRLRPTTTDDIDFVLSTERNHENRPFIGQWSREQHIVALADPDIAHLIVERPSDAQAMGYVILAGLTNPNHSIEFQRLAIDQKGQGYGQATVHLVKQMAFEQLNAHRLWLDVRVHNQQAQYVYEKARFVKEGLLRECVRVDGQYESLIIIMSILRSEYEHGA